MHVRTGFMTVSSRDRRPRRSMALQHTRFFRFREEDNALGIPAPDVEMQRENRSAFRNARTRVGRKVGNGRTLEFESVTH